MVGVIVGAKVFVGFGVIVVVCVGCGITVGVSDRTAIVNEGSLAGMIANPSRGKIYSPGFL